MSSEVSTDLHRMQSLNTVGTISYILHLVVAVGAIVPGAQFGPLLLLVALVIDLVKRDDAAGLRVVVRLRHRRCRLERHAVGMARRPRELGLRVEAARAGDRRAKPEHGDEHAGARDFRSAVRAHVRSSRSHVRGSRASARARPASTM